MHKRRSAVAELVGIEGGVSGVDQARNRPTKETTPMTSDGICAPGLQAKPSGTRVSSGSQAVVRWLDGHGRFTFGNGRIARGDFVTVCRLPARERAKGRGRENMSFSH